MKNSSHFQEIFKKYCKDFLNSKGERFLGGISCFLLFFKKDNK